MTERKATATTRADSFAALWEDRNGGWKGRKKGGMEAFELLL
jgi:hypothetical protein